MDYKEAFIKYYISPDQAPLVGDLNLATAIDELMQDRTGIVETGTYHADSSKWFVAAYPTLPFYTIDNREDYATTARGSGINAIYGDSAAILPTLLDKLGDKPFFYLDAHWGEGWPLYSELSTIGSAFTDPAIVIHDFDDGIGNFDPGNDLTGPVGLFLLKRSRQNSLALYRQERKVRGSVGIGMISVLRNYLYWHKDERVGDPQ